MTPTEVNAYYNAPNNYIGMYVMYAYHFNFLHLFFFIVD